MFPLPLCFIIFILHTVVDPQYRKIYLQTDLKQTSRDRRYLFVITVITISLFDPALHHLLSLKLHSNNFYLGQV